MPKNRRFWLSLLLCLLQAAPAFASRARELVMGTGDAGLLITGGSLYYDEPRNIFYNPALITEFHDWITVEKSNYPGISAEGGIASSLLGFSYGAYFNRLGAIVPDYGSLTNLRPLELFLGADFGPKVGVSLTHANFSQVAGTDQDTTLRLGASIWDFEPFLAFKTSGQEQIAQFRRFGSTTAGLRYHWGEWTPYLAFRKDTSDVSASTRWVLGIGRSAHFAPALRVNYALGMVRAIEPDRKVIPVNISLEAEATSWLTLRAGLEYRALDRTGNLSELDSTFGRIGAGLRFGKVDFDWAFGKAASPSSTTETGSSADAQLFDLGVGFFTAASLTCRW